MSAGSSGSTASQAPAFADGTQGSDTILITIFLKHDQSNNLDAVQSKLKEAGWWERFPPEGVEVVSWYVAMGFGQIVTVRLPPSRLAALNVELERSAWGVFRTECFPAYDFAPVREIIKDRVLKGGQ
ncbi:MAG: hypothetical protein JWN93_1813 [Hyphomicrobiales bacterium]|jgi:uncharacterized protein with GYD domain|nr:hypothetical protein [Hyphomicrobiales bacterium]